MLSIPFGEVHTHMLSIVRPSVPIWNRKRPRYPLGSGSNGPRKKAVFVIRGGSVSRTLSVRRCEPMFRTAFLDRTVGMRVAIAVRYGTASAASVGY